MRSGIPVQPVAFGLGLALVTTPASADVVRYGCTLNGLQVAPDTATPAIGAGTFVIDTDANTVDYRIAFTGLTASETVAHIHGFSDPGSGSGVLHTLPLGNPKVGTWSYDEGQEADLLAGRAYVNVHSSTFPSGEIRGQITGLNALLDEAQVPTPTGSSSEGFAVFTIDTAANTLDYYIEYTSLSSPETVAHIHGTALHGGGAGTLHTLPTSNPKVGTWSYAEDLEDDILAGRTYVNVHSTSFPAGEIRGQISPIIIPIDGEQEAPAVTSPGAGLGIFAIDHDANQLSYDIRFAGLTSAETVAHIHGFAPPGMTAGVLHGLATGSPKIGTWTYADGEESDLIAGLAYVNIHSSMFGSGEIRGQIEGLPAAPVVDVESPIGGVVLDLLSPTFPNPARATTVIPFRVDDAGNVSLVIYDVAGRRVRALVDETRPAGEFDVAWDTLDDAGRPVSPGVYTVRLVTPTGTDVRTLAVLR